MNSCRPLPHLGLAVLLLGALVMGPLRVRAGETAPDEMLIVNGTIVGRQGDAAKATVRNVVDEITRRYPKTTINVVDVDDVVVNDMKLRWPAHQGSADEAVLTMLTVLNEANHRQKFTFIHTGENLFVVTAPDTDARQPRKRSIAVFNLGNYLENLNRRHALAVERQGLESGVHGLTALKSSDPKENDRVAARLKQQISSISEQEQRLTPTKEEITARLEEIMKVVNASAQKFSPADGPLEFEYHAGTHLLIVIGGDRSIEVADKVVTALKSSD